MRLFQYIIPYDRGFAPNPYWGCCTLATCKPGIRRQAEEGDWVVGVGSCGQKSASRGKIVYAMRVAEALSFDDYATDPRFQIKIPHSVNAKRAAGDNIYYRDSSGAWKQRPSLHDEGEKKRDLSGLRVLVATHFFYFGRAAKDVPPEFTQITEWVRNYRWKSFDPALVERFVEWLEQSCKPGVLERPSSPPPVKLGTMSPESSHAVRRQKRNSDCSR